MKTFSKVYFEILFIVGLLLSLLVSFDRGFHFLPDFIRGMFTSLSILLIFIAGIVKYSKKIQEKLRIASKDERLKTIEGKASAITLYAIMLINVVCIIVFGFLGKPYIYISLILASIMLIAMIILAIAKLVLSKRM